MFRLNYEPKIIRTIGDLLRPEDNFRRNMLVFEKMCASGAEPDSVTGSYSSRIAPQSESAEVVLSYVYDNPALVTV